MRKTVQIAIPGLIALFFAWLTSLWLIPLAAMERGYEGAYGGEWLLIVAVFMGVYWAVSELGRVQIKAKKTERREKLCRTTTPHVPQLRNRL